MATIARWLIAFFFIASGSGKLFAFRQTSGLLTSMGFPSPTLSLSAFIAIEIAGGVALLLNVSTSYVAVALIAFLVFATITIHARFVRDPVAGTDQIVHIIKNVAIIGGLINFVTF
jgi:putative oxidoreductase